MTQKISLLNGENINFDYQITALHRAVIFAGVVGDSLKYENGSVGIGSAFIECERTNGERIMTYFENTEKVAISPENNGKIFVEVAAQNIEDGSLNAPDGTGIASIKTAPNFPEKNFLPIASINGAGGVTDARESIALKSLFRKNFASDGLVVVENGVEKIKTALPERVKQEMKNTLAENLELPMIQAPLAVDITQNSGKTFTNASLTEIFWEENLDDFVHLSSDYSPDRFEKFLKNKNHTQSSEFSSGNSSSSGYVKIEFLQPIIATQITIFCRSYYNSQTLRFFVNNEECGSKNFSYSYNINFEDVVLNFESEREIRSLRIEAGNMQSTHLASLFFTGKIPDRLVPVPLALVGECERYLNFRDTISSGQNIGVTIRPPYDCTLRSVVMGGKTITQNAVVSVWDESKKIGETKVTMNSQVVDFPNPLALEGKKEYRILLNSLENIEKTSPLSVTFSYPRDIPFMFSGGIQNVFTMVLLDFGDQLYPAYDYPDFRQISTALSLGKKGDIVSVPVASEKNIFTLHNIRENTPLYLTKIPGVFSLKKKGTLFAKTHKWGLRNIKGEVMLEEGFLRIEEAGKYLVTIKEIKNLRDKKIVELKRRTPKGQERVTEFEAIRQLDTDYFRYMIEGLSRVIFLEKGYYAFVGGEGEISPV